jgi:hypothetical protein
MSARLSNDQNALYAALDKYKAAVAQLAGVTTSRVAVLSFLSDTPATSLVGRRLAAATPLYPASSSSSSSKRRALQQSSSSSSAWSWELLPMEVAEEGLVSSAAAASSRGLLVAAASAAASAAGRLLLQSGSGQLEVYSRIATMGQSDADDIVNRINNATRQAEFEKSLVDAGLRLVSGSVSVKRAGVGNPGGGWGLPGLNWNDPAQRRIIIIVVASIGAALVVMLLIWWATCCFRRRTPRSSLQQQFISSGGRTPGTATPGSSQASGSSGVRPLFGAAPAAGRPVNNSSGANGRPLYNPFAVQPAAAATYGPSAYGTPAGRPPAGAYTVAGRTFATAKEADDYALALALSQSLQQQGQQPATGSMFSRYLPSSGTNGSAQPSQRQLDQQQQLSGYPAIGFGHGFGGPAPYR